MACGRAGRLILRRRPNRLQRSGDVFCAFATRENEVVIEEVLRGRKQASSRSPTRTYPALLPVAVSQSASSLRRWSENRRHGRLFPGAGAYARAERRYGPNPSAPRSMPCARAALLIKRALCRAHFTTMDLKLIGTLPLRRPNVRCWAALKRPGPALMAR